MVARDEFHIPHSRLGGRFAKGAEVHLTILMNLLRGEWVTRMDPRAELALVACMGLMLGAGLPLFRPHIATLLALAAALAVFSVALWLFIAHRTWFAWGVPALVQVPLGLGWAVGARYFVEERKRRALRDAFAHYLSPVMADRIAEAGLSIKPGGAVVEATTMFTDLDGFTPLAEQLDNPERIAEVLTEYFTLTTRHILEADGTILKFVGDAVHAVWGTPLADAEHARKAVRAAWRLQQASLIEVDGRTLRTRIGVHTGRMVAGNLGSAQRFDFAVTGDAVNFASRLEGLNKFLGTSVLISEETRRRIGEEFVIRRVGEFRVVGKTVSVIVHEVLGEADTSVPTPWVAGFERAVALFAGGQWDEARRGFEEVIAERGGHDGPSAFYLQRMEVPQREGGLSPSGIIELSAK
jgi:adenylate cyclase